MENQFLSGEGVVTATTIVRDMHRAGFTSLAASIATRLLGEKKMIAYHEFWDGDVLAKGYRASPEGEAWLLANQERLMLQREPDPPF